MRFFLVVILSSVVFISAGQSQLDSLQRLIDKESDSKRKVELLNELAFSLFDIDVEQSVQTSLQAIQLAQKINDRSAEGWATAYHGIYFLFIGSLEHANENFSKSLKIARDLDESNLEAYSLMQFGNVCRNKGVFDSSYYFYQQAEKVIDKKPDPFYESAIKMNKCRYYLVLNKPDSALLEVEEALKIRNSLNVPAMMPDVWLLLGNCYRQKFDLAKAEQYYDMVLKAVPEGSVLHVWYLLNMGELYFSRGDFSGALRNWSQVLTYFRKINYQYELSFLLYRMGEVFEEQGYYDLATEYLTNSLKVSEKGPFLYLISEAYYELAWVYYRSNNLEASFQSIQKSETMFKRMKQELRLAGCLNLKGLIQYKKHNYDSALYYHQRGLQERERIGNKMAVSSSLYNLADLFNAKKEYRKSLSYLWRGVKIDEEVGDGYGRSLYYYQLGKTYNLLGAFDSAKYYLEKALVFAIPSSANEVLRNSYFEIADYYQKSGKPNEAINYYKKFIQLTDTIFNKQTSQSVASYRILYDVEKKQQEINLLNKDNLLVRANAQQQKILFYAAIAGSLILVGMAVFYYRFAKSLKKLNSQILEKSEEVQTQSEKLTDANSVLAELNKELEESNVQLKDAMDDLHTTQGQLIQAEKMASLGVLSSGVAHELNNPLNFIKGGVNALTAQLHGLDENKLKDVKPYVDIINEGVNRASAILKGLSHFSRQSDKQNEECDLHKIIDNCLLILNNKLKHRITIEKHYSDGPVLLAGNEGRLHQAFLNILSNAEQAIADKGTIRIETKADANRVSVSISDSGCGISQENLSKVSDPFFTTKPPGQGTGLGLSITYAIIEDHNGKVSIQSEVDKGTEFLVLFSLHKTLLI